MSAPVDERLYSRLMERRRREWVSRAARATRESQAVYAQRRASAIARPFMCKVASCGRRGVRIKCGCRGWRGFRPYTCRQPLVCDPCRCARSRRMGARIRDGLESSLKPQDGYRGGRLGITLVTLTLRHSGNVARDRAELAAGWRALRKRLWRRWGWFPYVGVWEVTPGDDGIGHVHAHIAAVWPWRDWGVVRELWLESCPRSERITFVRQRRDGRESTPRSVANYLAKYLSKGTQAADFTPQLMSRILAGTYNTRWVFSSRGFWQFFEPMCQRCSCPIVLAQYYWHGDPTSAAPEAIPDWCGSAFGGRGPPQCCLPLPEPH